MGVEVFHQDIERQHVAAVVQRAGQRDHHLAGDGVGVAVGVDGRAAGVDRFLIPGGRAVVIAFVPGPGGGGDDAAVQHHIRVDDLAAEQRGGLAVPGGQLLLELLRPRPLFDELARRHRLLAEQHGVDVGAVFLLHRVAFRQQHAHLVGVFEQLFPHQADAPDQQHKESDHQRHFDPDGQAAAAGRYGAVFHGGLLAAARRPPVQ